MKLRIPGLNCLEVIGDEIFQEVVIRRKESIIITITMGMTSTQSRVILRVLLPSSPIKSCKKAL